MNNPDIQKKARAEIDAVIGRDRLPNIADRSNLPYFEAVCKEVVRCTHIADQSLPHRSRADDIHEGYFVPKNTLVIPNLWWEKQANSAIFHSTNIDLRLMGHDPRKYKNGDKFDPTRFLGDAPEADPRDYAFGFGRRICPGKQKSKPWARKNNG
jgi:cytochrome P450